MEPITIEEVEQIENRIKDDFDDPDDLFTGDTRRMAKNIRYGWFVINGSNENAFESVIKALGKPLRVTQNHDEDDRTWGFKHGNSKFSIHQCDHGFFNVFPHHDSEPTDVKGFLEELVMRLMPGVALEDLHLDPDEFMDKYDEGV